MSDRWPGGVVSATPSTPTGGGPGDSAPGIWTIEQISSYISSQTWPGTGVPDPQFQYVTALLHGDGTNGGQNNTFLDSSSNNFTITRNGNTTQGSFSPYGNLWSNYFVGNQSTAGGLSVPNNAAFDLGSGDFTIEFWVNGSNTDSSPQILLKRDDYNYSPFYIWIQSNQLSGLFSTTGSSWGPTLYSGSRATLTKNAWNHCAIVRSGTTFTTYVNGVVGNSITQSGALYTNTASVSISSDKTGEQGELKGYISNLRIVKGSAIYSGAFTPSTTPLTAISGTSLLTCQSNQFKDTSSNSFTVTPYGSAQVRVQRFSPFQNLATYQTAVIGGSGYFDGSGDYLNTATSATAFAMGTGDYTIEGWGYKSSSTDDVGLFGTEATGIRLYWYSGVLYHQCGLGSTGAGGVTVSETVPALNQWFHWACVRNSGTIRLYINGVSTNSTGSATANITSTYMTIGRELVNYSNYYWPGYISNVRVVKGTAVYTTNFTPPTAPLTAITNTQLLTNFTNGSIYDSALMNDLETVGSAQISTSVVKYGTGSIATSAAGNYLSAPSTPNMVLLGNFTIEAWVYPTATAGSSNSEIAGYGASGQLDGWHFYQLATTDYLGFGLNYSGVIVSSSMAIPLNTWSHVAVSRVGTTYLLFINGNQVGTATSSTTQSTNASDKLYIGTASYDQTAARSFIGYIDDFRITNGYARYWFNFQPPTAPYPNYGGTLQLTYDPYFENTTLLLNGEGTNGAQNNTFLDSSTNNFTITRNGNTTQGSFSPYGSLWSNYFNGTNSELTCTGSALSGQFTMEGWVCYSGAVASGQTYFGISSNNGGFVRQETSSTITFLNAGVSIDLTGSFTPVIGQWYHIAVTRNASNLMTIWVNGTSVGSATVSYSYASGTFAIGANHYSGGTTGWFPGYISNVRLVTGYCLYTTTFTPSTTPLTAVSGTQVLTCQSNRFIDNSSNAYAITVNGSPSVQRFSPFNPTSTYSTSVIGGSGYLATGGSDYLTVASNAAFCPGTSAFCVEFWYNKLAYGGNEGVMINTEVTGGLIITIAGGGIALSQRSTGNNLQSSANPIVGQWNHIVVCRDSSNNTAIFLNGVRVANGTVTANYTTGTLYIGNLPLSGYYATGYYSDVRIEKGSTPYNPTLTTLTVPTAPLTAVTNTSLLTNFTNAGIPDLAMMNNLETVGNAQVSTAQYKYGTSSLYFDGTGDSILSASSPLVSAFSGNFTVECWVYISSLSSPFFIWTNSIANSDGMTVCFVDTNGAISTGKQGVNDITSSSGLVSTGSWNHFAYVGNNGTITVYLNGSSVASGTQSTYISTSTKPITLGRNYQTSPSYSNGYIDDFRVSYGLARYVQPFTPPTAALPTY